MSELKIEELNQEALSNMMKFYYDEEMEKRADQAVEYRRKLRKQYEKELSQMSLKEETVFLNRKMREVGFLK